jgi:hypothetical protein
LGGEEKVLGAIHRRRQGVNAVRIAHVADVGNLVSYGGPLHGAGDQDGGTPERHDEHLVGKIALIIQPGEVIDIFRTRHQTARETVRFYSLAYGIQALRVFVRREKPVVIHDLILILQGVVRLKAAC